MRTFWWHSARLMSHNNLTFVTSRSYVKVPLRNEGNTVSRHLKKMAFDHISHQIFLKFVRLESLFARQFPAEDSHEEWGQYLAYLGSINRQVLSTRRLWEDSSGIHARENGKIYSSVFGGSISRELKQSRIISSKRDVVYVFMVHERVRRPRLWAPIEYWLFETIPSFPYVRFRCFRQVCSDSVREWRWADQNA